MSEKKYGQLRDRIRLDLAQIRRKLDTLQENLVKGSELVGFLKSTVAKTEELWTSVPQSTTWSPQYLPFLTSTGDSVGSISREIDGFIADSTKLVGGISGIASTATSIGSGSVAFLSTAGLIPSVKESIFVYSPLDTYNQHKEYEHKLTQLDKVLGETYGELIEILGATRSDPERPAMFLARQLFDHLFDVVAPDDKVRGSRYWRPKTKSESKDPNAVWRREKIAFAAFTKVRDPSRAVTLESASAQTLEVYQLLNKAHKRGMLKDTESTLAVESMVRIIQQWTDAIS